MSASHPAPPCAYDDPTETALDWFVRRRAGLDAAETAELQAWLSASPRHGDALERWAHQWDALDALPAAGISRLRDQLAADLGRERRPTPARWRGVPAWAAFGAAALLLTAGGLGYWHWDERQQHQAVYAQSFATARGQQTTLTLPDGSRLSLDAATQSQVTYYRQRREVRLPEGQVMLEVAKDPSRPFDVIAGPLRITVLGTRFAVRYTPASTGDGHVHVAVEQGHVSVTGDKQRNEAVELRAGQQVDGDAQGHLGAVAPIASDQVAAWRDGCVSFQDAPLSQVLAEFERYGDTGLLVPEARVAALRLTGTFNPRHLENFRRVLPQILPVRLRTRGVRTEILTAP